MRVGFVEWPEDLVAHSDQWSALAAGLSRQAVDLLVTNELPFGPWIASSPDFDPGAAEHSMTCHRKGLRALEELGIPAIISSRPVMEGDRLANEAFCLQAGEVKPIHRKQYFPAEPGWYEEAWYATRSRDFTPAVVQGVSVGVLLCTELMFNERARHYRQQGAELIVVPRATGRAAEVFQTAAAMASIVSGCYVVSSNRVGCGAGGPTFGGKGFAYAPGGELVAVTASSEPLMTVEIDTDRVRSKQAGYPCYVAEPA